MDKEQKRKGRIAGLVSERVFLSVLGIMLMVLDQTMRDVLPDATYWSLRNTFRARIHEYFDQ